MTWPRLACRSADSGGTRDQIRPGRGRTGRKRTHSETGFLSGLEIGWQDKIIPFIQAHPPPSFLIHSYIPPLPQASGLPPLPSHCLSLLTTTPHLCTLCLPALSHLPDTLAFLENRNFLLLLISLSWKGKESLAGPFWDWMEH